MFYALGDPKISLGRDFSLRKETSSLKRKDYLYKDSNLQDKLHEK